MRVITVMFATAFLTTTSYEMTEARVNATFILVAYAFVLDIVEAIGRMK